MPSPSWKAPMLAPDRGFTPHSGARPWPRSKWDMEPGELVPRLVAILAGDAVNYSRLMAGDDQATIRALDTAREVFRRCASLYAGRVVDTAGDSVLAVFNTAMSATSAALAIQSDLNAKAEQASADRRLWCASFFREV